MSFEKFELEELNSELKKQLRSLIISSPIEVTLKQLRWDYQEFIGSSIPFQKFGYKSLEQYLHSISDVCKLTGYGDHAVVVPVVTEDIKHINELVLKQKDQKFSLKYKPPKRSRGIYKVRNEQNYVGMDEPSTSSVENRVDKVFFSESEDSDFEVYEKLGISKGLTFFNNNENEDDEDLVDEPCTQVYLPTRQAHVSKVSSAIKNKLSELIRDYPDGIWCSTLSTLFQNKYNVKLEPRNFGFASVIEMCEDVPDVFFCVRPKHMDWKLLDVTQPIANRHFETEQMYFFHPYNYPDQVLHPGDSIKRQWLENNEQPGDYLQIVVSDVFDPSRFWIQLNGLNTRCALNRLMDNMQEYYMQHAGTLRLNEYSTRVGLMCAALFLDEYHRAVIIKEFEFDGNYVKVFFVDYGTVNWVHLKHACFLHKDFARLPIQAIRARLANIIPLTPKWTRAASNQMRELILQKDLVALIDDIEVEDQILNLIVTDTTEPDIDVHINDEMVKRGVARFGNEPVDSPLYDFNLTDYNYSDDDNECETT